MPSVVEERTAVGAKLWCGGVGLVGRTVGCSTQGLFRVVVAAGGGI